MSAELERLDVLLELRASDFEQKVAEFVEIGKAAIEGGLETLEEASAKFLQRCDDAVEDFVDFKPVEAS